MKEEYVEFSNKLLRAVQYQKDLQIMPDNKILQEHFKTASADVINLLAKDSELKLMNKILTNLREDTLLKS